MKDKIYNLLAGQENKTNYFVDYFISTLIILSIIAIILESFENFNSEYHSWLRGFEIFSVVVFTLEYICRIWISDKVYPDLTPGQARRKYIFSVLGIVDFMAILPFYIPMIISLDLRFIRALRLLRLFRIFKLAHYSSSLKLLGNVLKGKKEELVITIFACMILLMITSSLIYEIEHDIQPDKFPNIFASFWWSIATLTTIGYGDVYPISGWGQFLAAITALFGIGLVAIPTGIISSGYLEELSNNKKQHNDSKKSNEFNYCPHCGKKLKEEN